ncbi:alpha/beta hydrolase [Trueperella bernardiae]|uniref:Alpha/beta hydrolase n=1 Tax=Trueperella bernardiae TaxID=59561 RepID=A0AAW6ZLF8_9ACTO|nr:alpha/beta hydrolase [Trueperella bernardiae]MDK8601702.1 alpha/beta hydrolase [Trueperella bernardiae]MDV6238594.1 alpha/beta hydrolase [Trueperella bernardiae]
MSWTPDFLGDGFYQRVLPLHDDEFGPNRATLVTYRPGDSAPTFAVLAIHGWNDYFYQYEFALEVERMGGRFYAIDLRKYGRSHLDDQMWGYIEDLSTYDEEIHEALDVIYSELGDTVPLFLYGHSTGGLTATLWADRHPDALAGVILNSPWLEFQGQTALRLASQPILDTIHRLSRTTVIPMPGNDFYHRLLTGYMTDEERAAASADPCDDPFVTDGGWHPDPRYRQVPSFPIRAGWLRAIANGHERVAQGLDIQCPILVLTSAQTFYSDTWNDQMRHADTVLNVDQIWKRVPWLGRVTTLVKVPDAIHDVLLSRRSARQYAYGHIERFVRGAVQPDPGPGRHNS